MRIRKFNENEVLDISSERVDEIVSNLSETMVSDKDKLDVLSSYINELDQYRDTSSQNNDQIDDAISNLQLIRGELEGIIDKYDSVISNLNDYKDSGRDMLY